MTKRRVLAPTIVAALALLGAAPQAPPPADGGAPPERPAPVHPDVPAMERAVVDTTIAFVRSDAKAARAALDRIDSGCRRLSPEEAPGLPQELIVYDQAFHKTVDLAREFSSAGQIERAFDQFAWAQRACRVCHGIAEKAGIKPAPKPSPVP